LDLFHALAASGKGETQHSRGDRAGSKNRTRKNRRQANRAARSQIADQ
jgi:hypothetical protein